MIPTFELNGKSLTLNELHANACFSKNKEERLLLLPQLFKQLNNFDNDALDARFGGLIIDNQNGDIFSQIIPLMAKVKRPLSDLIIIDPNSDLFRYNPIDFKDPCFPEKIGARLVNAQTATEWDNKYLNDTSKNIIKMVLKILKVVRSSSYFSLKDIYLCFRYDDNIKALCGEVEESINRKLETGEFSSEQHREYLDACRFLSNSFIGFSDSTKSILKSSIDRMIGPLAEHHLLEKTFCLDTNFSFRQCMNEGKIVVLKTQSIDKDFARVISIFLKHDFQDWVKRRNGYAAKEYSLNINRTLVFWGEDYDRIATLGSHDSDECFFALSGASRVSNIIVASKTHEEFLASLRKTPAVDVLLSNTLTQL